MLGELNDLEIRELLSRQVIGRVGFHHRGVSYIVPINYVYKNGAVYGHSGMGHKIKTMRKHPEVCFEVEEIESLFRWKSVVVWGKYEEITGEEEKNQAMQALTHRLMPYVNNPANHPSHGIAADENKIGTVIQPIIYKIVISSTSGRYEFD